MAYVVCLNIEMNELGSRRSSGACHSAAGSSLSSVQLSDISQARRKVNGWIFFVTVRFDCDHSNRIFSATASFQASMLSEIFVQGAPRL